MKTKRILLTVASAAAISAMAACGGLFDSSTATVEDPCTAQNKLCIVDPPKWVSTAFASPFAPTVADAADCVVQLRQCWEHYDRFTDGFVKVNTLTDYDN